MFRRLQFINEDHVVGMTVRSQCERLSNPPDDRAREDAPHMKRVSRPEVIEEHAALAAHDLLAE